jgi:hypothetical protein
MTTIDYSGQTETVTETTTTSIAKTQATTVEMKTEQTT